MGKIDLHQITSKQKKQFRRWLRMLIQLLYFLFLPSAFTAAFAGVKYIFTQIGAGEKIGMTSFVTVLIVLCIYTVVFGRFFCGFACAFGTLGDAVHGVYLRFCKKIKCKPVKLPACWTSKLSAAKYIVLTVIAVMCFAGIYGKAKGTSPWDVFSMIHAGNFKLDGYIPGLILLILLLAGMAVQERFFCRFLCPMGAIFSLLPVLPFFSLHREREQCIKGCSGCTRVCPSDIELPSVGTMEVKGDCFQCQKCIDTCPRFNIRCGIQVFRGNEMLFTIFRALLLFFILMWMGL